MKPDFRFDPKVFLENGDFPEESIAVSEQIAG
jgi:hypothetical protein